VTGRRSRNIRSPLSSAFCTHALLARLTFKQFGQFVNAWSLGRAIWPDKFRRCVIYATGLCDLLAGSYRLLSLEPSWLRPVILPGVDLLHPVDSLAREMLNNSNVSHGGRCGSPVPMLHTGWNMDDVTGPYKLDGIAAYLHPTSAGRHNQHLSHRMVCRGLACL
jgi:hypothetical protein